MTQPLWLGCLSPHLWWHYIYGRAVFHRISGDTTFMAEQAYTTSLMTLHVWQSSLFLHLWWHYLFGWAVNHICCDTNCVAGQSSTYSLWHWLPVWLVSLSDAGAVWPAPAPWMLLSTLPRRCASSPSCWWWFSTVLEQQIHLHDSSSWLTIRRHSPMQPQGTSVSNYSPHTVHVHS